jgi:hypothetical protein
MSINNKLYVIRKYIKANSAQDAIKKEKKFRVDDVWLDEDYKNAHLTDAIGFSIYDK